MDADTPTRFNAIVISTGLTECILAAALSKAGYSVLQLDQQPHYGSEWASLSLSDLVTWADDPSHGAECSPLATLPSELLEMSYRFSLSLLPVLLPAKGQAIDVLIRSKVAAYLQFGALEGVGIWRDDVAGRVGSGEVERVPGSKAEVFGHKGLSLIEKRRLTKLLLLTAGEDRLEGDQKLVDDPQISMINYLEKGLSLTKTTAHSLAYALALCSSKTDHALPALKRLRTFLQSIGRYSPSPFLVGHYGGAGDLIGGFSRICAVWGGGQILGRPILPLIRGATSGLPVLTNTINPATPTVSIKPPMSLNTSTTATTLGVPVMLDPAPAEPLVFTADWVISSPSHLDALFPAVASTPPTFPPTETSEIHTVQGIIILPSVIPFPASTSSQEAEGETVVDVPDSNLFVFPTSEREGEECLGTVTALQMGNGTNSCPMGYSVLYLSAPVLTPTTTTPSELLSPYLASLLSLSTPPLIPAFTLYRSISSSPPLSVSLPDNFLVVNQLKSIGSTASLAIALEESVIEAERLFWSVVGDEGRKEGVEFFASEKLSAGEEEE